MTTGIIVNPHSGGTTPEEKKPLIAKISDIFGKDCRVRGFDTTTTGEFRDAARELSDLVDKLIIIGGDGTFYDVINAVPNEDQTYGFIPLGTGNALRYTLHLPKNPLEAANRIVGGAVHNIDTLECIGPKYGGQKMLFGGSGFTAQAIDFFEKRREKRRDTVNFGWLNYVIAAFNSLSSPNQTSHATIELDGITHEISSSYTTLISKLDLFGPKFRLCPGAEMNDGYMHLYSINGGFTTFAHGCISSLTEKGNQVAQHLVGKSAKITLTTPQTLFLNGSVLEKGVTEYQLNIRPNSLKVIF